MAGLTSNIPNNYVLKNKEYLYKVPQLIPTAMFLNTVPIEYAGFDDLIISVFDYSGVPVEVNVATLQKVDVVGGYRIYYDDFVIDGLIPGNTYYPVIYNSITEQVILRLNCFQLVPFNDADKYVRLEYRNSTNMFNYNYEQLPDFYNIVYADLNMIDAPAEYNLTQYFEASTGEARNQKSQLKDTIVLEGYMFDKRADFAMKALSMHDTIIANLLPYTVKEGWSREFNVRNTRSKGTISLYVDDNNTINLKV